MASRTKRLEAAGWDVSSARKARRDKEGRDRAVRACEQAQRDAQRRKREKASMEARNARKWAQHHKEL